MLRDFESKCAILVYVGASLLLLYVEFVYNYTMFIFYWLGMFKQLRSPASEYDLIMVLRKLTECTVFIEIVKLCMFNVQSSRVKKLFIE